jgi:hypothetical protein
LSLEVMRELEAVLTGLADKLRLPLTIRIEPDLSKAC